MNGKAPMFTMVLTNQLDRTLLNFSNGSPLALNSVLSLSGFLAGFHDEQYNKKKQELANKFNSEIRELEEKKLNAEIAIGEYDEKRKSCEMEYANELFSELNSLMFRMKIHPSKPATDDEDVDESVLEAYEEGKE